MIKRKAEYVKTNECSDKGFGDFVAVNMLANTELPPNVRFAGIITVKPGERISYHQHNGDSAIYHILEGYGEYTEEGMKAVIEAGDTAVAYDGQMHGIKNIGDSELKFIAFVTDSINPYAI